MTPNETPGTRNKPQRVKVEATQAARLQWRHSVSLLKMQTRRMLYRELEINFSSSHGSGGNAGTSGEFGRKLLAL